jgi:hypothetical protein
LVDPDRRFDEHHWQSTHCRRFGFAGKATLLYKEGRIGIRAVRSVTEREGVAINDAIHPSTTTQTSHDKEIFLVILKH